MVTKNQIKLIKSLHQKKFRKEAGAFIVEGSKPVEELLSSSFEVMEIYAQGELLAQFPGAIEASKADMERMTALKTPPGVLAMVRTPSWSYSEEKGAIIALDGVSDPGNLGTLIRTADWFGITQLVCSEDTVDEFNPKTVQASMGSLFRVRLFRCNLPLWLSEQGLKVYGLDMAGESLYGHQQERAVYVLGKESTGLSDAVRAELTNTINIPGKGMAESLNVGIAGALLMSELSRT